MAPIEAYRAQISELRRRAEEVTANCSSLVNLLEEEQDRTSRADQVALLTQLRSRVRDEWEREQSSERSAESGHRGANAIASLTGLAAAGLIKLTTTNPTWQSVADRLLSRPKDTTPFGTLRVCIGADGLPGAVQVASVSRLARDNNRTEGDVFNALRTRGYLVLDEATFSRLLEIVSQSILEGRLSLPIPAEKLQDLLPARLSPSVQMGPWVPVSKPPATRQLPSP